MVKDIENSLPKLKDVKCTLIQRSTNSGGIALDVLKVIFLHSYSLSKCAECSWMTFSEELANLLFSTYFDCVINI